MINSHLQEEKSTENPYEKKNKLRASNDLQAIISVSVELLLVTITEQLACIRGAGAAEWDMCLFVSASTEYSVWPISCLLCPLAAQFLSCFLLLFSF